MTDVPRARRVVDRLAMWGSGGTDLDGDDIDALRAVVTPSAEADQRLGAAVRATGVTPEACEKLIRDLRNLRGSLTLSSSAYSRAYEMEISVFAAVADALRKETA